MKRDMPTGSAVPLSRRNLHLLSEMRWLLGYALVVQTAFQFLLKAWSEILEIILFLTIIGGFLLATYLLKGLRGLVGIATDTWTQRLATLFLLALALSFLWGDHSIRSVLAWFRLPTYLIMIAIMVETMREGGERVHYLAWTILGSVCFIYMLVFIEFYFGSSALGLGCGDMKQFSQCWDWEGWLFAKESLMPILITQGRTLSRIVTGYSYNMSTLGLFSMLGYALGIGIILNSHRILPKLIAAGLVTLVLIGLILTGSRSVTLVVLVLWAVLAALLMFNRASHLIKVHIVTTLIIFAAVFVFWRAMPTASTSIDRILPAKETPSASEPTTGAAGASTKPKMEVSDAPTKPKIKTYYERGFKNTARIKAWQFALELISDNPVKGVGLRMYKVKYSQRFGYIIYHTHNSYLEVITEAGLLGAVPFLALLAYALVIMLRPMPALSPPQRIWKVVFSSAFIGILTISLTDIYIYNRYFWIILAFAAVLEVWKRDTVKTSDHTTKTNAATA